VNVADETEAWLVELRDACIHVASRVARDFSAIEADDLAQELFLEAWRAGDRIENRDSWLYKVANALAIDLHEKLMKYKGYSQYEYTPNMVRQVLEYSFVYQNWEHLPLPDSARSAPRTARAFWDEKVQADVYQSVNDPTDSRDVAADVQSALDMLSESDRVALIKRYKFGLRPSAGAETTKLYRAVKNLTKKLNSYKGLQEDARMSGRKAMRNSAAQAHIAGLT
jgi:DNA-directed RNA polymerase specialized sigma24 family protein